MMLSCASPITPQEDEEGGGDKLVREKGIRTDNEHGTVDQSEPNQQQKKKAGEVDYSVSELPSCNPRRVKSVSSANNKEGKKNNARDTKGIRACHPILQVRALTTQR